MAMSARAIVLAAGKGTRMKSSRPKVLHELCGRSMLWWSLEALRAAGLTDITVVTNPELQAVLADGGGAGAQTVVQKEQTGTGDAVRVALDAMPAAEGTVLVTYADMPLLDEELLRVVLDALAARSDTALALVTARMPLPSSFGRIVRDRKGKRVARIVEARDCTPEELAIDEMNAGVYAYDESALRDAVAQIDNRNAQGEYYLTDTIALLAGSGRRVVPLVVPDYRTVLGINDRVELASARAVLNSRLCERLMRDGVTIVDPATTYVEFGVQIGTDTVVHPGTSIGRNSSIGTACVLGPRSRIEAATVGDGVRIVESVVLDSTVGAATSIGPYAHLRGGSRVGARVRIGNFVELKNAELADDVKANHLAYIGDAVVGARTNVGAGTITANFDGERKHRTEIGADVKIGTNTSLVAPVTIGDGAVTGAGTVVIRDVPAGERVVGNPARTLEKKTAPT
jgi:bifunctional UDP-N-acetylglucosamine pyrophosphorylase/glucosamine-1-phosphate N-acetyltransferase